MHRPEHPYLAGGVLAIAHRGGWVHPDDAPRENSVYAFRRAVELGYRYLETDVHATRNGTLVAFHDVVLDRVTDATGRIAERTWDELAGVRIGGVDPIPTLEELLAEFPDACFNIDLKADAAVTPLVELLRRSGAAGRVCVGSFSGRRLAGFRRLAPDVATSASPRAALWATHARGLRRLAGDPGIALQIPARDPRSPFPLVRADVVRWAHRRGRVVHVWTINEEAEMHRLLDLGVDGIVSDDITTLKRVLAQRGLWEEPR